jgi:hypothetical protein
MLQLDCAIDGAPKLRSRVSPRLAAINVSERRCYVYLSSFREILEFAPRSLGHPPPRQNALYQISEIRGSSGPACRAQRRQQERSHHFCPRLSTSVADACGSTLATDCIEVNFQVTFTVKQRLHMPPSIGADRFDVANTISILPLCCSEGGNKSQRILVR